VAAVALLTVAVAAPQAQAAPDDDFVLRRDGSKAVPVTPVPESAAIADGFDWGDAAIGAGAGVAALLLVGSGAHAARSRQAHRRSPLSAAGS
jgi:hypothetical protein